MGQAALFPNDKLFEGARCVEPTGMARTTADERWLPVTHNSTPVFLIIRATVSRIVIRRGGVEVPRAAEREGRAPCPPPIRMICPRYFG